ncbi:MAG: hypothetical protein ACFCVG_17780, partial [Kineosporiaceae bacterium]
ALLAGARSRARWAARSQVLAAQREAWANLRAAAVAAAADLPEAEDRVDAAVAALAPEVSELWRA